MHLRASKTKLDLAKILSDKTTKEVNQHKYHVFSQKMSLKNLFKD